MHPPAGAPELVRASGRSRQKGLWLDVEVPTDEAALRIACALHERRATGRWEDGPRGIWAKYSPAGAPAYERMGPPLFDASRRPTTSEHVLHSHAEAVVQTISIAWMRTYEWYDGPDRPPVLAGAAPASSDSVDATFPEGAVIEALHRSRERNAALVAEAKRRAFARDGKLACTVCGFDFALVYGRVGEGYIEAHHTRALSTLQTETESRVDDLALVCANCHRMLHRHRPWLEVHELKALVRAWPTSRGR